MRHGRSDHEHDGARPHGLTAPALSLGVRRWVIFGLVTAVVLLGAVVLVSGHDPRPKRAATAASVTLAGLDGSYVLVGTNPYDERLYRVAAGRLRRVADQADFAGATAVTARGRTVMVALEDERGRSTIRQVRGGRLESVSITSGYSPSLSAGGALAWASADTPRTDQVTVFARDSPGSRRRVVATFDNVVVGTPIVIGLDWAGADLVVGIVRYGVLSALGYRDGRGPARAVGRLRIDSVGDGGQVASFVAGGRTVVLASEIDSLRRSLDAGASDGLSSDDYAVCITDTDDVLTDTDGTLRLAGAAGRERLVGRIPPSLVLFDASCAG